MPYLHGERQFSDFQCSSNLSLKFYFLPVKLNKKDKKNEVHNSYNNVKYV